MAKNSAKESYLMAQIKKLYDQSKNVYLSYLLTGDLNNIQEAVRLGEEALNLMPPDSSQLPVIRYNLARILVRRFLHTRQVEDITKAIELFGHASQPLTDENSLRMCSQYLTASSLLRDSKLEGSIELEDLHVCSPSMSEGKIKVETLFRNPIEDAEFYRYCLSKLLKLHLPPQASLKDIDSAIQLCQQALKFFSPTSDALNMSIFHMHLGDFWSKRYLLRGLRGDNDRAIDCICRALKSPMTTLSMRTGCLCIASEALISRFEALGRREDIVDAVDYIKDAVNSDSQGPGFEQRLDNLARALTGRFKALGEKSDLDDAICASRQAVAIAECNDSVGELPRLLANLAAHLEVRYGTTSRSEDLRLAIEMGQKAADLWPTEDPRRVTCLVNLSKLEMRLSRNPKDIEYQDRALKHLEKALECVLGQDAGVNRGLNFCLHNYSGRLLFGMKRWDDAIKISRIFDTDPDYACHPQAGRYRLLLCDSLFMKWTETKEIEYLDEAISTARRMIELVESEVGELLLAREILGTCLVHRYKDKRENKDLEDALSVLLEGFQLSAGPPVLRISLGQQAIDILSDAAEWDRARKLSQEIVDLIVLVNGRSLDWTDKQFLMQIFSHQVPTYASIALQAGSDVFSVINMLETCRGSILGHLIDNRTDLDDLRRVAPQHAERFCTLRDEIDGPINRSGNMDAHLEEITRKGAAEAEFRSCLEEIRKVEGLDRFLLGPAQSELHAAAVQGPLLIVNVTSIRSDAIIITKDTFDLLELPELTYEKVAEFQEHVDFNSSAELRDGNKKYIPRLKWLWDNCVKLIFKKLKKLIPGTAKFHVWWMGIGIASSLPFHAAGIYTKEVRKTALSRAISSYTPTLKILIHGRRKLKDEWPEPAVQRLPSRPEILIVSMPSTADDPKLKLSNVKEEAEKIQKIVEEKGWAPQPRVQPSAKDTMKRMEKCELVHFACHGKSIFEDPSSSHLLLQATNPDSGKPKIDELRVRDVAALNLSHGKLAFLSACSTAENRLQKLWDEALHLASVFHVAGYLHTVGNLWPANDKVSVQIVEGFYQHLVEAGEFGNGQNVARALNEALVDVMQKKWKQPLAWVSFVHFGV